METAPSTDRPRGKSLLVRTLALTALFELVTVWVRFGKGLTAADFGEKSPSLLRIHHLFWSLPLSAGTTGWHWPWSAAPSAKFESRSLT